MELLPNRTKTNIQAKAKQLGLTAPGASKKNAAWSEEEDEIIKKYYPIGGIRLCKKYLPKRTELAIKTRANVDLKIYMETARNKPKVIYLIENNRIKQKFMSISEAAKRLNISEYLVKLICTHKCESTKYHLLFEDELEEARNGKQY